MKDFQKQAIRDMRQKDLSFTSIATTLGLSINTIKSFCRRENIVGISPKNENTDLCKNCNNPLDHILGSKKKIFCSDKCRYNWWGKHRDYFRNKGSQTRHCSLCDREFYSKNKKQKYCGRECYIQSHYRERLP